MAIDTNFFFFLKVCILCFIALLSFSYGYDIDSRTIAITVEKNHVYPSAPPLTRYKETSMPIMKKKLVECILLDDNVISKLNQLTVSKLCVRLNTLNVSVFLIQEFKIDLFFRLMYQLSC